MNKINDSLDTLVLNKYSIRHVYLKTKIIDEDLCSRLDNFLNAIRNVITVDKNLVSINIKDLCACKEYIGLIVDKLMQYEYRVTIEDMKSMAEKDIKVEIIQYLKSIIEEHIDRKLYCIDVNNVSANEIMIFSKELIDALNVLENIFCNLHYNLIHNSSKNKNYDNE